MLRIEIVYPFLLSCFREKQKEKEDKRKKLRMEEFCGEPLLSLSFANEIFLFQRETKIERKYRGRS